MLIENPKPADWKALQMSVCRLFTEIGLTAAVEKKIVTPRGEVEVDVWAMDEGSVDKITYLVECKNWAGGIPQAVVHSFTTVMREVGANIGFIVSQQGLQAGATKYTASTNIQGFTYEELQRRYLSIWISKYFMHRLGVEVDSLLQYLEPINHFRETRREALGHDEQVKFIDLQHQYAPLFASLSATPIMIVNMGTIDSPDDFGERFQASINTSLAGEYELTSRFLRDLLEETIVVVRSITVKFDAFFGRDIFL